MKIAVLSDIHGNHIALEAVLKKARQCNIERLFILGDSVGYYYHPDKVIELLEGWPKEIIQGNHERMLKEALGSSKKANEIQQRYGSGINFALDKLSDECINYLTGLPDRKNLIVDGLNFELCHGSPWDMEYYVYPDASREILDDCLIPHADFIFMGHTHYPFTYSKKGTIVANVGSVGQPRDTGGMASWAIADSNNHTLVFMHTIYDTFSIIEEVKNTDKHLPYLHEVLTR